MLFDIYEVKLRRKFRKDEVIYVSKLVVLKGNGIVDCTERKKTQHYLLLLSFKIEIKHKSRQSVVIDISIQ